MGNTQVKYDVNPLWVHWRKHNCTQCGSRLKTIYVDDPTHTEPATFRDHISGGVYWFGKVEFKICVFYCPQCKAEILPSRQKYLEIMNP